MEKNDIKKIYEMLNFMKIKENDKPLVDEIKQDLENEDLVAALTKLKELKELHNEEEEEEEGKQEKGAHRRKEKEEEIEARYPKGLDNTELEHMYIGMLINDVKSISMYYFIYEDCYFADDLMLNIYKSILFTEGQAYAPEAAKRKFNFAKQITNMNGIKHDLKQSYGNKGYDFEKIYVELKKLFILRKNYLGMPIKMIQDKIIEITNYKLYEKMTIEEVESAVEQVTVTGKFKKAILNEKTTDFLIKGDNQLTNGIALPFPVLTEVFKGIRQGETMAFAMPSNSGKSRFTINLAAYIAFVHRKKVLIISNEMSEEKMRLCLITTILNNSEIQKIYGQKISKTEGELLEFKFRPDDPKKVEIDEDGFIVRGEKETQKEFSKRLANISTEFNQTIEITKWLDEQINNSIYFINITDHTNDELHKVIMNYYYKEKIEYMFYDTLKTDIENIGNGEELKKTTTILSNLAQEFNIFIGSTLQLAETNTSPINLNINDLAVSRTVKEVLDTLCLLKQIHREGLDEYEYSAEETDTKVYDLKKYKDPDVRYYSCVVDKNRAGAKPKLLFRLNLAYNMWEELGYLRLKQGNKENKE